MDHNKLNNAYELCLSLYKIQKKQDLFYKIFTILTSHKKWIKCLNFINNHCNLPKNKKIYILLLFRNCLKFNNLEESELILIKFIEQWPDHFLSKKIMVSLLFKKNEREKAFTFIKKNINRTHHETVLFSLLKKYPDSAIIFKELTSLYAYNRDHEKIVSVFSKFSDRSNEFQFQNELSLFLYNNGFYLECIISIIKSKLSQSEKNTLLIKWADKCADKFQYSAAAAAYDHLFEIDKKYIINAVKYNFLNKNKQRYLHLISKIQKIKTFEDMKLKIELLTIIEHHDDIFSIIKEYHDLSNEYCIEKLNTIKNELNKKTMQNFYELLAVLYKKVDNIENAAYCLEKQFEINNKNIDVLEKAAEYYSILNNKEKQLELYEKLNKLNASNTFYEQTITELQRAITKNKIYQLK